MKNFIKSTKSFKAASEATKTFLLSESTIELFKEAYEMKEAGMTFKAWEESTGAGKTAKAVVKQLFNN
jgi:hypothetical protein